MNSLSYSESLVIPRMYSDISFEDANHREVLEFAYASKNAVAAVAYLKLYDGKKSTTSFLMGKAKLAPMHGHTIPRLELCVVVLATEIAENIRDQPKIPQDNFSSLPIVKFCLDGFPMKQEDFTYTLLTVLGEYIFLANHLNGILSEQNIILQMLLPLVLMRHSLKIQHGFVALGRRVKYQPNLNSNIDPEQEAEIRPEVVCCKQEVDSEDCPRKKEPFSNRFSRFSSLNRLVRIFARIKYLAHSKQKVGCSENKDGCSYTRFDHPKLLRGSKLAIIACVQRDSSMEELKGITESGRIPHNSTMKSLSPVLDSEGLRTK